MSELKSFMNPESVAIVGASRNPRSFGYRIVKNLLDIGFRGKIYPVNPKAEEIADIKAYKSLADLPESAELVVIALPGKYVIDVLSECKNAGIKNAIITAPDVADKREVTRFARNADIRILGPSTVGLINLEDRFAACVLPVRNFEAGRVSFLAHSGGLSGSLGWWRHDGIEFNKIICLGEGCDVGEVEALEMLAADPATEVILAYLQPREPEFFRALEEAALRKPVIFLDPAGSNEIEGVTIVENYQELFEFGKLFSSRVKITGNHIGVLGVSSGSISIVLESMKRNGLVLADLSDETKRQLQLIAHPWIKTFNPMDIWPPIELSGEEMGNRYMEALAALMDDPEVDGVFVVLGLMEEIYFNLQEKFRDIVQRHPEKPLVVVCWQIEAPVLEKVKSDLNKLNIPFYVDEFERPVRAYAAVLKYSTWIANRTRERAVYSTI